MENSHQMKPKEESERGQNHHKKNDLPLRFPSHSHRLDQSDGYVKYNITTDVRSVDWQSLTFMGERHHFDLRIAPPNSQEVLDRLCNGLEDAEFSIPGMFVAD